jgi:hypothetical protein
VKEFSIIGASGTALREPTEGAVYRGVTSRTATTMSLSQARVTYQNGQFHRIRRTNVDDDPVSMDGYAEIYEEPATE